MRSESLVAPFVDELLRHDLPRLPDEHRQASVAFVIRRISTLPDVTRAPVMLAAALYRAILVLPAGTRLATFLAGRALPLAAEYPRLVRSLAYAFVWERWPLTGPLGEQS